MTRYFVHAAVAAVGVAAAADGQSLRYVKADAAAGGNGLSWATAYADLQDALADAHAPGSSVTEIWVAQGVYRPDSATGDRTESFRLRSGLMVLGGFAGTETSRADRNPWTNATVLSGDLAGDDSYHVVVAYQVDGTGLLDGFHITAGRADGGGIHSEGGGIRGEQTQVRFANCVIRGNTALKAGGAYFYFADPVFFNCRVAGNHALAEGGGVTFAAPFQQEIHPAVINCTFTGNSAVLTSQAPALNCITSLEGGECLLRNSVLWDNKYATPTYFPSALFGRFDAAYTLSQEASGWPPWVGNPPTHPPNTLYANPKLVNAAGPDGVFGSPDDDPRLTAGSPCIDSGDNTSIPADAFDLDDDGNTTEPWPFDAENGVRRYDDPYTTDTGNGTAPIVDMGAFEGPAIAVTVSAEAVGVPEGSDIEVQVRPTRDPISDLTVTTSATGDPDIAPSPASLVFTPANWQTTQPVTISAAQDGDSFEGVATVSITGPGVLSGVVTAHEVEDDAPPGIVYVKSGATGANTGGSWTDAFTSLSAALTYAAGSGGQVTQIWVAAGTYKPAGPITGSFALQSGLALYGGFAGGETSLSQRDWVLNPTILSGDTLGNDGPNFVNYADNKIHAVSASNVGPTAILDGFIVQGGSAMAQNPSEASFGGGLFIMYSRPTIRNVVFRLNQARINGGGVFAQFNALGGPSFLDCAFDGNRVMDAGGSDAQGGGIFANPALTQGGAITFERCIFTSNSAATRGGGAYVIGAATVFRDCEFASNTIVEHDATGGGLYLYVGDNNLAGNVLVQGCRFHDHSTIQTYQFGAGMAAHGHGTLTIDDCDFEDNEAAVGGGLYVTTQGTELLLARVVGSRFLRNHAILGSGAISLSTKVDVDGCTFAENTCNAPHGVGGFGKGTVKNCAFVSNSGKGPGGAAAIANTTELVNCTFADNEAVSTPSFPAEGGALNFSDGLVRSCVFVNNRSLGANSGGGAVSGNGAKLVECVFQNNWTDGPGGAVVTFSVYPVQIHNCVFTGNQAGTDGGAFYGNGTIVNCSMTGNAAAGAGGAIWAGWSPSIIANCSIAMNTAATAGGVYAFNESSALRNTVLWNNTHSGGSGESAQVKVGPNAELSVSYSCIQGWTGSLGGAGNVGGDPVFFDPLGPDGIAGTIDDDLTLTDGSSCIDAAENAAVRPDWFDLDGDMNTAEPTPIDLRSQERFIDDDETQDTGAGTAPIVDIGAHEFLRQESAIAVCYPDCNNDDALTIADFGCFQTKFVAGDPYADCNGGGGLTIADFACFQTKFVEGCP